MPGLPVSSRTPRSKMRIRSASGMPMPSSSTMISTKPACAATVTNTLPPPYLAAFSTRLPMISSRSCRSICATRSFGPSMSTRTCGYRRRTARSTDSTLGHTCARLCAEPRRPTARARARWWSTCRRIVRASRTTVSARSSDCAVAAFMMTVSGVLSAWARFPAWRRASSACVSLCATSAFSSSTSGSTSSGMSPAIWFERPARIFAISSRTLRSGHRP